MSKPYNPHAVDPRTGRIAVVYLIDGAYSFGDGAAVDKDAVRAMPKDYLAPPDPEVVRSSSGPSLRWTGRRWEEVRR